MNKYNKGFMALFFTLGVSSILLAYVSLSSQNMFDFIHTRENFKDTRIKIEESVLCADQFIDLLIRSLPYFPSGENSCGVNDVLFTRQDTNTVTFSFNSNHIHVEGSVYRGFVSNTMFFYISL